MGAASSVLWALMSGGVGVGAAMQLVTGLFKSWWLLSSAHPT